MTYRVYGEDHRGRRVVHLSIDEESLRAWRQRIVSLVDAGTVAPETFEIFEVGEDGEPGACFAWAATDGLAAVHALDTEIDPLKHYPW